LPTLPPVELGDATPSGAPTTELTVLGLLGEGGMGRVLLAHQRSLARDVAVKVLKNGADDESLVGSLLAEARLMGHLEHPAIVPVHALGRDPEGRPVLVMRRIEGAPWSELLRSDVHPVWEKLASLPAERRAAHLEILLVVCNAAHFAHSRGVVHRDLKPDNVMIGGFGEVYLTDWGIGLPLGAVPDTPPEAPILVGTPAYMAPEMARGDPREVDARTDVYLLGAILHEILTGTHRNPGASIYEALRSAFAPEPVRYGPDVPEELALIANRATAAEKEARFPDVAAFQKALSLHLHHRGAIALTRAAEAKLAELEAQLAAPPSERADDAERAISRLAAECHFGFLEALRGWEENHAARVGLDHCLEALVEDDVRREDARDARVRLGEMSAPPPELVERVEALERALAARAVEREKLEAMARNLDPGVAARARNRMMAGGFAVMLLIAPFAIMSAEIDKTGVYLRLVVVPAVLFVITALGLALGWKRGLVTTFNRRAVALLVIALAAITVHRWISYRMGDPIGAVLRGDAFLLAALLGVASLTQFPRLAVAVVPCVIVGLVMPSEQRLQLATFGIGAATAFGLTLAASVLERRGKG
jgi:serine/threonine-protein kinase